MIPLDSDDALIDRLVDGELDDEGRRALLRRLDASPDGWRRCALAFLEAREWQSALGSAARPAARSAPIAPRRSRRFLSVVSRAAAVALVFALGMSAAPRREPSPPLRRPSPPEARLNVPRPPAVAVHLPPPAAPSYLVGSLERQGYRIDRRTVLVPARTPSGRRVAVPIEEKRLRFVGNRAL